MPRTLVATLCTMLALTASAVRAADTYKVDPVHSFAVFKIGHLGIGSVWGQVMGPTGTITVDPSDPSKSSVQVEVKVEKLYTGVEMRDKHLKSPDFFDAAKYPTISFKSTSVKPAGENTFEVAGELSLHGVTRPLTVTLTKLGEKDAGPQFGYRSGYETSFTLKRSDFGMTTMPDAVGDEVKLFINIEAVKQ